MLHLKCKMKGQGVRFVGTQGRRDKLWWPGNDAGSGGVEIFSKETLEMLSKKKRLNDGNCVIVGKEVIPTACAYGPQNRRRDT